MTETFNNPRLGLATTIAYSTTSGGSYTPVGQLKSIDGTSWEMAMFDSSGINDGSYQQVPTQFKAGDYSFKIIFDPANTTHIALQSHMIAGDLLYWKQTFPSPVGPGATVPGSPNTFAFAGYLSKFATSGYESESGVEADVTIAITGAVTSS